MKILKVTKKQGFTFCLENTFLEKPQGIKLTPPAFLGLMLLKENVLKEFLFYYCETSEIRSPMDGNFNFGKLT